MMINMNSEVVLYGFRNLIMGYWDLKYE